MNKRELVFDNGKVVIFRGAVRGKNFAKDAGRFFKVMENLNNYGAFGYLLASYSNMLGKYIMECQETEGELFSLTEEEQEVFETAFGTFGKALGFTSAENLIQFVEWQYELHNNYINNYINR